MIPTVPRPPAALTAPASGDVDRPPPMPACTTACRKPSCCCHSLPIMSSSFSATPCAHHARFVRLRSEEHTSELQSLMRISYAVFCLKKKNIHSYSPQ